MCDMLSVDGDADAAVEARIRIGWNKFRQLVPLLNNNDVSLIVRGRLHSSYVRSSMLHGSETWPVRKEPQQLQQQTHNSSTTAVTEDIAVKIAKNVQHRHSRHFSHFRLEMSVARFDHVIDHGGHALCRRIV